MPRRRRTIAELSEIARGSLPLLSSLFQQAGLNILQTINLVRGAFNLSTQREAARIVEFGRQFAATLSQEQLATTFGTLEPSQVRLDPDAADPSGLGRRFRYRLTAEVGGEFRTLFLNTDALLTNEEVRNRALRTLNLWTQMYPGIAAFLQQGGPDEIEVLIQGIIRRF